ncbi:DUF4412 domain-containing protein [candidate division WOR-3 bacterium]|nr:DUF4412 domain-containing protein [candidate division WOR-3 bacterium]
MRIFCFTLSVCFASMLLGDVMYEMTSTMSGMMGMQGQSQMRVFIKGDRSLTEMTAENPMGGTMSDTRIIRLDKDVMWSIDHENKTYSEYPIKRISGAAEGNDTLDAVMPDLTVTKTGDKKKILGKECEKIIVSMKIAADEGDMTFTQTMWVSQDVPGYREVQDFQQHIAESGMGSSSAMMGMNKASYEEFRKKISEIEGFPLEIDIEMTMGGEGMSFTMNAHSEVTNIETTPINDKVFEIPPSYSLQE